MDCVGEKFKIFFLVVIGKKRKLLHCFHFPFDDFADRFEVCSDSSRPAVLSVAGNLFVGNIEFFVVVFADPLQQQIIDDRDHGRDAQRCDADRSVDGMPRPHDGNVECMIRTAHRTP